MMRVEMAPVEDAPPQRQVPRLQARARRRIALNLGVGLILVALLALAGFAGVRSLDLSHGRIPANPSPARILPGDRLVRIDVATKQVVAAVTVGKSPSGVTVGDGSVWVTNSSENTVYRIDPATNKVISKIAVGKEPEGIAFGSGAVWVANKLGNSISVIEPGTNSVVKTIAVDGFPQIIVAGDGAVFVGTQGLPEGRAQFPRGIVVRIDTSSRTVTDSIRLADSLGYPALAEANGAVWAGGGLGVIAEIDPATGHITRRVQLQMSDAGLTIGDEAVWVATSGTPALITRVEPRTGSIDGAVPVGNTSCCVPLVTLAAGNGFVWVANADDGTISQIAESEHKVTGLVDVGGKPTGVALGFGSVWVTVDQP